MNPLNNLQMPGEGIQNALLSGLQIGQQFRQEREQREKQQATDNAFRGMMAGDPNAVNVLAQVDPRTAYSMQQQQIDAQRAAAERQTRIAVASGQAPASELAGINWDDYAALTKEQAAIAKENIETIGQLALMADTPQKWDATVSQLGPEYQQYIGQFGLRESVIARAGEAKAFLEQQEPKYQVIPKDGDLVNTRDPQAIEQWNNSGASALPPGFVLDEGGPTQSASGGF